MALAEYAEYDGLGLAELVRGGHVTPAELTEAAIARVEAHNGQLNAVVHKGSDEARATAAGDLPDGPFRGVPFLIKDLGLQVKGWPRTSASRFAQIAADDEDSELTRRYRRAGTVLLGKTNTPEFGIPGTTFSALLGPCRNPWDVSRISGGSSGGAASAVASGMVPMAHASDGLGSIRIPAAICGLVGMKTTRDRNPNGPEFGDRAMGLSVDHVVTRTVRDSAAMLDATGYPEADAPYAAPAKAGPYLEEVSRSPGRLRIGWSSETPRGRPVSPEVQAALEKTAQTLSDLGHEVFEAGLGIDYREFYRAQALASASNFAAGMVRWIALKGREPTEGEIEPLAWRAWQAGRRITGEQAMWGYQTLRLVGRRIVGRWSAFDVWLCPVLATDPPPVEFLDTVNTPLKDFDARQGQTFPFTPPFNVTGQPSLSLPLHQSAAGLPMGMMFTGRYADEATLYRLAGQLEKEMPWRDRRPAIYG